MSALEADANTDGDVHLRDAVVDVTVAVPTFQIRPYAVIAAMAAVLHAVLISPALQPARPPAHAAAFPVKADESV
jgi:hypothetical protein